ncbi:MAG: putative selenoprotein [Nitrosomonadales bacterium]|jgi:uncharacterized short protein YbdD (DUF466 family)|uniref:DUF466 domain-containing protein n=1 Tax=Methylophilales bacterium HTCC2181 TaxID=383631 RepID=A0P845_9PROT|nr:hypothetical protein MB2181_06490 [Methylophilales bacterium HTCC2181]MBT3512997.1 putative selenoprotein [Nitrosomonadales bacterium]MBT7544337.1 putative selenoprotein [Kordiimonadaceae bacterium]MCH9781405.1 putative selenoprotein [Betaproteobacteria bacterium]MBT5410487.1 putative selenoprotein [Nitrosomonadales bacterium]
MFSFFKAWNLIRTISGDNEYDIYLENYLSCKKHKNKALITRRQFFKNKLDEKWSKINRCC